MCGEHVARWLEDVPLDGIIPACAGSTSRRRGCPARTRDRPRMCGEHLPTLELLELLHGIIPACAGSTNSLSLRQKVPWDHPRMCGEHLSLWKRLQAIRGSSPHVRGALLGDNLGLLKLGIIPACAGSTLPCTPGRTCRRDHPRMCGEHQESSCKDSLKTGSSPHVRGAPRCGCTGSALTGIIPACAGSTQRRHHCLQGSRDHPRMCGEHRNEAYDKIRFTGSSPHVRGALARPRMSCGTRGDHPRMCGEHRL